MPNSRDGKQPGTTPGGNGAAHIHLDTVQHALEQAQACLLGETPEAGTVEQAKADTLEKVRNALLHHVPGVRRRL